MSEVEKGAAGARDWVEVADEPDHREVFSNELVRVYVAFIRPGRETLYHRHDKDTLYVVLEGGRNYSSALAGSKAGAYVFPKSISLTRKVRWLLTRSLFGWTYLPKSVYVLMHNDGDPIIHRVRGAADNPSDMRMMGIEFLQPGGRNRPASACVQSLPMDYEDDTVRVHRLKFPAALRHLGSPARFTGLVIALEGGLRIESSSAGGHEGATHDLKEGNLLWNDGGRQFTFLGTEGSKPEALLIRMK
jgi:hypothetical protein